MAAVRFLLLLSLLTLSSSLSEHEALLKLKKSLSHSGALDNWVSGTNPCSRKWVGVRCFSGIITGLHLSDLGLSGTIDTDALVQLRGLRTISFINNSLSGPVPEFNKLGALKSLLLSHNEFSGEIPNDFFSPMSSLKKVWLSNNKFTGKIPDSVMELPHLIELHLEGNQFSGPIPLLKQPKMVTSFDLSHNNLEGPIPKSYASFSASSFEGNEGLCGKPLDRDCSTPTSQSELTPFGEIAQAPEQAPNTAHSTLMVGVAALVVLGVFVMVTLCSKKRHKDDDFSILEKENFSEVATTVPSINGSSKRPSESSRKGSTRRGSHHAKNSMGDLIMVNEEKGTFGLPDLMKAAAEVLGNGGLGSAYKATMTNGLSVAVKRMREMNTFTRDGFDAEMRRFGRIRHKNILTPLAYHFRKEEKLLVSEYMPKGSLLYVLHGDRGISHAGLNWETRLKIIKGIASGLGFLHKEYASYKLPYGNLKSSNVLLNENYDAVLSDYALEPLTNPDHATQTMFAYKSPEYIHHQQVSPKSDVYCLGVIILEVLTGKFPSQYLSNGKGGTDVVQWVLQASGEDKEKELIDPEISSNTNSLEKMVKLLRIGAACAESDPSERLDVKEAISRIEEIQV